MPLNLFPALASALPYTITIDAERALARVWFSGITTGRDLIAATNALVAHPDYAPAFNQLWGLADVTSLDISPVEMTALITHDRDLVEAGAMGPVKVAIVITTETRELAIRLYQYQMRTSGQDVRLFETEEAAETWLQEA